MTPWFKGKKVFESSIISLILLFLLFYILFQMFKGFYLNILLGLVLAIALRPLHVKISNFIGERKAIAALLTILLTLILIVIPLFLLVQRFALEAINVGRNANTNLRVLEGSFDKFIDEANLQIAKRTGNTDTIKKEDVTQFIQSRAVSVGQSLLGVVGNFFSVISGSVILFMTIYYALTDWERLRNYIYKYSPLTKSATKMMATRALAVIRAALRGNLVMIFVQGFAGGLGFWIFGLPSPFLLGALYGLASLVPVVGTGTIWIPSVAFLALTGRPIAALLLAIWNAAIVGSLDNVIMPSLVRKGASLHPFLILIGVLGGLSLFGLVGFIIGPTLIALTLVSIELFEKSSSPAHIKVEKKV